MLWILPAGLPAVVSMILFGYALIYLAVKFLIPFNQGLSGDILGLFVVLIEILALAIITVSFE